MPRKLILQSRICLPCKVDHVLSRLHIRIHAVLGAAVAIPSITSVDARLTSTSACMYGDGVGGDA